MVRVTVFTPKKFLQRYLDQGYVIVETFTCTQARFADGKPAVWYSLRKQ